MTTDAQLIAWYKDSTAKRCVLMEIEVRVGGVETTRYLSNRDFLTRPSETPANTLYKGVVSSGVTFTESLSLLGEAALSQGDIEFNNVNGEIDSWQNDIWQNRRVQIFVGDETWDRADFYKIFDGVTAKFDCSQRDKFQLKLSDKLQRLNTVVSEVKLGGSGPNKDKLLPLLFGECHNITPLLVDLATLEYQVHAGPIEDFIEIRDNGIPLANSTIGWSAVTRYLSTGKFRLNQQPVGIITCSAQGDKPTTYSNDAVTLIKRLAKSYGQVTQRFVDGDLDLTTLSTFASANTQPLGLYLTEKSNVLECCNRLVSSVGARVHMTRAGLLSIVKIDLPQATAGTTITSDDIEERSLSLAQLVDVVAAVKLGYCKNWTVQTALQVGIPVDHIELFGQEWLTVTQSDATVATNYRLFTDPNMIETLLLVTADATAECTRLLTLNSAQRRVVRYVGLGQLMLQVLGGPQTVVHTRFGLGAGVRGQIISMKTDWLRARIEIEVLL